MKFCACSLAGTAACFQCMNNSGYYKNPTPYPLPFYTPIVDYDLLAKKVADLIKDGEKK